MLKEGKQIFRVLKSSNSATKSSPLHGIGDHRDQVCAIYKRIL